MAPQFFPLVLPPDYQKDIEGGLWERFERRAEDKGIRSVQWRCFKDVMKLFRPGVINAGSPQSFSP